MADNKQIKDGSGSLFTMALKDLAGVFINRHVVVNENNNMLGVDTSTRARTTIEYEHHEIHEGDHYFYTNSNVIASAGTQVFLLTTPDTAKWAHMTFVATGSAITQVDLYEAGDRVGDTAQTARNSNRNSLNAAGLVIHKGVTGAGSTDGTLIWTIKSGAATQQSRAATIAQRNNEIILKQNTKYLIRFTSGTADNLTNLQLEWYEHTDKTD